MTQKKTFVVTVVAILSAFIGWPYANGTSERTLILLKPDTVQRGLIGRIIQRFEDKGLKLVALKFVWPTEQLIEEHYSDLREEDYYKTVVNYMISGPVVSMIWEGFNVTANVRKMIGSPYPLKSLPGTIRGDFSNSVDCTVVHGSDSVEAANREINLWFQDNEFVSWTSSNFEWIYGHVVY